MSIENRMPKPCTPAECYVTAYPIFHLFVVGRFIARQLCSRPVYPDSDKKHTTSPLARVPNLTNLMVYR